MTTPNDTDKVDKADRDYLELIRDDEAKGFHLMMSLLGVGFGFCGRDLALRSMEFIRRNPGVMEAVMGQLNDYVSTPQAMQEMDDRINEVENDDDGEN